MSAVSLAIAPYESSGLGMPSPADLGAYTRFVNALPMLTPEQEQELAQRWAQKKDPEAAKSLVISHLRVVVRIAREYSGYGLPQEDLIQEGNIGLMKAVRGFDPSHGARLVSYSMLWIRAQIQEYILENWRLVKIGASKGLKKLFFNLRSLQERLSASSPEEQKQQIAKALGVEEREVETASRWFAGTTVSLDGEPESEGGRLGERLGGGSEPELELIERQREGEIPEAVERSLRALAERERKIMVGRYLTQPAQTLASLSHELGVSLERVRQIEGQALKKMRQALDEPSMRLLLAGD